MAILQRMHDNVPIHLPADALVGRDHSFDVLLRDAESSAPHARLRWVKGKWRVHDLASRNGTYIGNQRLDPGRRAVLRRNSVIRFGTPNESFKLVDGGPPTVLARQLASGDTVAMTHGLLNLPDSAHPLACLRILVQPSEASAGFGLPASDDNPLSSQANVQLELNNRVGHAVDREVIELAGELWQLRTRLESHAGTVVNTPEKQRPRTLIDALLLTVDANMNLEQITLTVKTADQQTVVNHHAWHYLLMLLARERWADQQVGRESTECGWLLRDDLAVRRMKTEVAVLNVQVFRARGYFRDQLGVDNAGDLIERRSGSTELRLGIPRIQLRGYARQRA